jgi:transposase
MSFHGPEAHHDKQGNPFVRMLLVESAQTVNRLDEGFRKQYVHRCHRMPKAVAKVAAARRLAVRLFWMLRTNTGYPEIARIEGSPREAVVGAS